MAISISRSQLPEEILTQIYKDLTLTAKGLGRKGYKPKVSQLIVFNDTIDDNIVIPIQYARKKFNIQGLAKPQEVNFDVKPAKYREGQKEVFAEALKILCSHGSVFLQLHCGWGKTWMALNIIGAIRMRTMILIHRKFLGKQFLKESELVIPGEVHIIDKKFDLKANMDKKVFICTERRALKLPDWFIKNIDFIVIDEAKYWCTPDRVKALLCFKPKFTMGLCAERERKDGFNSMLDMFFGPVIFRKSNKPFIVWKYHTKFEPTLEQQRFGKGPNWTLAMQSLAYMEERNIVIRDICRLRAKDKIMILVTYVEHLQILEKMLIEVGESVGTFYGSKDNYKNCRILLATYSKAEMGFDDANLCEYFDGQRLNLLILGSFYKKEIEQSAGRVMRSDAPEIIDIVDDYSSLKKHSQVRDKWFRSRNGRVMPPEFIFPLKRGPSQK